jgi:hypothetical protein
VHQVTVDLKLAEIIAELANEARLKVQADIPRFIEVRKISSLFHFTSIRNLESIVSNGFLGRESLTKKGLKFNVTDEIRHEPVLDGICFSLSRPNYYMAARKIISGHEMILLELQDLAGLLTNYNFITSPGNFGSPIIKNKVENWPEEFIGGQGLMNLFRNPEIRRKYAVPDFEPTDPQAEVIFLERLPWSYVKKIYFPNATKYSVKEEITKIVRGLPTGVVFQSQVSDVFPDIDWKERSVVDEYNERRWNAHWKD